MGISACILLASLTLNTSIVNLGNNLLRCIIIESALVWSQALVLGSMSLGVTTFGSMLMYLVKGFIAWVLKTTFWGMLFILRYWLIRLLW